MCVCSYHSVSRAKCETRASSTFFCLGPKESESNRLQENRGFLLDEWIFGLRWVLQRFEIRKQSLACRQHKKVHVSFKCATQKHQCSQSDGQGRQRKVYFAITRDVHVKPVRFVRSRKKTIKYVITHECNYYKKVLNI